jgi:hypothetical protein
MGGPHATVEGGAAESWTLTHGPRSTVRAAVELDSKKKFQIRLKSNGSNGFKFLHTLTASNRTFLVSKFFLKKYGFEDLGEMNNFLHSNFSILGMVWEYKFREDSLS